MRRSAWLTLSTRVVTLSLLVLSLGCGGGGKDAPVLPGLPPDPDPGGGLPGPDPEQPGGGGGVPSQPGSSRGAVSGIDGSVTLPGFSDAPAGSKASRTIKIVVLDENGQPIPGSYVENIRTGGEFVGVIVTPDGSRAPRIFFSQAIPDRFGGSDEREGAVTAGEFGELVTGALNIAIEDDVLVVRITIPTDLTVEASGVGNTRRYYADDDLVDRLLIFGDRASFKGVYSLDQLPAEAANSLSGQGGYVFLGAPLQNGNKVTNWQLEPSLGTSPNDPQLRRFLRPMLSGEGALQTFFVQEFGATAGATKAAIQTRLGQVLGANPVTANLGPAQRYLLLELDLLRGNTQFTGQIRKLLFVLPVFPRALTIGTADGDGKFGLNIAEAIAVTADFDAGSTLVLGPAPDATTALGPRTGLTGSPIRPGDVLSRPGPTTPTLRAVDELQRNLQAFYFIPDYFAEAATYDQSILGGTCENCIKSNVLPVVGPNGVVTNLNPSAGVSLLEPIGGTGRMTNDKLAVLVTGVNSSDPDGAITYAQIDWGDNTDDTVIDNTASGNPVDLSTGFTHDYTTGGTFTITLTVRDNGNPRGEDTDTTTVTATPNALPVIVLVTIPEAVDGIVSIRPGRDVEFNLDDSSDADSDLCNTGFVGIDFGDGVKFPDTTPIRTLTNNCSPSNPFLVKKTYNNVGSYTVIIKLKDIDGGVAQTSLVVEVAEPVNQSPIAVAEVSPDTGEFPLTVQFSSANSSDPDGIITEYIWNFDDPAVAGGGTSILPNPSYTYTQAGVYDVTLTVRDNSGLGPPLDTGTDTVTVTVTTPSNLAPLPVITVSPLVELNVPVQFSSALTTDPDGNNIVSYVWDFGDGQTSNEANPVHTYINPPGEGFYLVNLTVTDDGTPAKMGQTDTALALVEVTVDDPWAIIVPDGPTSGASPFMVGFDGSLSYSPVGDPIVSWEWEFSDFTTDSGQMVSKTYTETTVQTVKLTVTDDQGHTGFHIIPVYPAAAPPTGQGELIVVRATSAPIEVSVGSPIQFSSLGTHDPEGAAVEVIGWNFGDGTATSTELNPSHIYASLGTYQVTFTATEDVIVPLPERQQTAFLLVRVVTAPAANELPVAIPQASSAIPGDAPIFVEFTAAALGDVETSVPELTLDWDFGDGGTGNGELVSHEYTTPGVYSVALTIGDGTDTIIYSSTVGVGSLSPGIAPILHVAIPGDTLIIPQGSELFLDLNGTVDPDGDLSEVVTDWEDRGAISIGLDVSHVFGDPGRYRITVTATDLSANLAMQTFDVIVTG